MSRPNLNSAELLQALGAATAHEANHPPVRDYFMDGVRFAAQFIQSYAATADELQAVAMEVEADTYGADPDLTD